MSQLELFPETVRVERIDPTQNMRRFYRMHIQPDLFGGATLFKEWGRIGTAGRQRIEPYADTGQAVDALAVHPQAKARRGYSQGRR